MYLKISKQKNGRTYLSITEGFRQNGQVKSKTVEKCGYLDDLLKDYTDPIAHFKMRAKELTEVQNEKNEPVVLKFSPLEKIDIRKMDTKHLGHAVLSYYYHLLGLDRFWKNRQTHTNFIYDANAIFKLLTYLRVTHPGSKAEAFRDKDAFVERMDFKADDMYRALSFFAGYEKDLVSWIDKAIKEVKARDTTCVYYDVTNYYFEIEAEDDLRKRGVSKEHRPNPIVSMGLMLDSEGIPLDYRLFKGNTNDCLTLMPILKEMRAKHKAKRLVVVADKGLNTSDNIAANILDGNGFVFSQSVRGARKELKDWIISPSGYIGGKDFRIKDRIHKKSIIVTGQNGKKTTIDVDVREVAFWSKDFALKAKAERAKVIEKSLAYIEKNEIGAAKAHTAVRYVTDTAVVLDTGERANHVLGIDIDKIKKEEATDGYYCIIKSEIDKSAKEIIDIYRGLWRIEETFRVTKSTLETRPVYVSRHDRIHAHFLICYTALVLLRLIQKDLNWQHSASEIAGDIAAIDGVPMKKNYYLFSHRTHLSDKLGKLSGIDLSRQILSTKEMREIFAKTKKC